MSTGRDCIAAFDAWGEAYPIRADRPLYYLVHRGSRGRSLDCARAAHRGATMLPPQWPDPRNLTFKPKENEQ